jgi:hypothetical protein
MPCSLGLGVGADCRRSADDTECAIYAFNQHPLLCPVSGSRTERAAKALAWWRTLSLVDGSAGRLQETAMRHAASAVDAAIDALLQTIIESEQVGLTFSAVCDGGSLTTWREPGRTQLGPDFSCVVADPVGAAHWAELHRLGEDIHAAGGLDAVDETIMRIVQMDPASSDWRAMVLESVWFDVGRAS